MNIKHLEQVVLSYGYKERAIENGKSNSLIIIESSDGNYVEYSNRLYKANITNLENIIIVGNCYNENREKLYKNSKCTSIQINKLIKKFKGIEYEKSGFVKKNCINIENKRCGKFINPSIIEKNNQIIIKNEDGIIGYINNRRKFPIVKAINRNDLILVNDEKLYIYKFKNIEKRIDEEKKYVIKISTNSNEEQSIKNAKHAKKLIEDGCRIGDELWLFIKKIENGLVMVLPDNRIAYCAKENDGILIKKVLPRKMKIDNISVKVIKFKDVEFKSYESIDECEIREDILLSEESEYSSKFEKMINRYKEIEFEALEKAKLECERLTYTKIEKNRLIIKNVEALETWENKKGQSIRLADREKIELGTIENIVDNYIEVDFKDDFVKNILPKKGGEIEISVIANEVMQRRRSRAIEAMKSGIAPIKNLSELLSGELEEWDNIELKENLKEAEKGRMTLNQVKAINSALNTADILLIQGPPGTGKTSVIRKIVERLINEKKEVLVSSFQNLAVDNVLDGFIENGVIPYRFGTGPNETMYKICCKIGEQIDETIGKNISMKREEELKKIREELIEIKKEILDIDVIENLENKINKSLKIINNVEGKSANYMSILNFSDQILKNTSSCYFDKNEFIEGLPEKFSFEIEFEERLSEGERLLKKINRELKSEILKKIIKKLSSLQDFDVITEITDKDYQQEKAKIIEELNFVKNQEKKETNLFELKNNIVEILESVEKKLPEAIEDDTYEIVTEFRDKIKNNPVLLETVLKKFSDLKGTTCQKTASQEFNESTNGNDYNYVIIDEAARANPLDLLIPLIRGEKIILVGDHKQLPHMIEEYVETQFKEDEDYNKELFNEYIKESLFGRLFKELPENRKVMLDIQFRMNKKIGDLVSRLFYGGSLKTGTIIENDTELFNKESLVYLDVKGMEIKTTTNSYINKKECQEIITILEELENRLNKPKENTIGIITFYKAQADYIRGKVKEVGFKNLDVSVGTVDAYQGLEKEIIIISTVRTKGIGFTSNPNRLNVALSRAKKIAVFIGDKENMKRDKLFKEIYLECINGRKE